jgi:4-amino-4-deoxy-L-arabinose transferase-like glycosyltransferase
MLSREDSRRLAQLERQLLQEDPEFCARMASGQPEMLRRKRPPLSLILTAVVAWISAIVLGVFGWWVAAAVAALCATAVVAALVHHLVRRHPDPA